jgi:hypothetical protein
MMIEPLLQVENPQLDPLLALRLRRSTRERVPLPQSFRLCAALSARVLNSIEPTLYKDALRHKYSVYWKTAIQEEYDSLDRNKTWDLMDEDTLLKSGKRAIGCKWVFKLKRNANGSNRFKARLVIKGYEQEYGIDYNETFALVTKIVTV